MKNFFSNSLFDHLFSFNATTLESLSLLLNYLPPISAAALGIFYLAKDWDAHKKNWRRMAVLLIIIAIGVGGIINTALVNARSQKDQGQITALDRSIKTNAEQFFKQFGKLSQELSDLKIEMKTAINAEEFRKKADRLEAELQQTQQALTPRKARLDFSFEKSSMEDPLLRRVRLPVKDDVVRVEFTVRNGTETPALNGELTVIICDRCSFNSEPPGYTKSPGQLETRRSAAFTQILPMTEWSTQTVNVRVPRDIGAMEFGINYRCANCTIPAPKANMGIVELSR